jgi:hypothetical protein
MNDQNDVLETPQGVSVVVPQNGGLSFIEQLQKLSTQTCTKNNRPYLVGVSETDKIALLTRPPCKMWDCPACGAKNAARWIARIINHINRTGGEWFMFTLTAHEKWRGALASVKNLRQGWKKLYNRMRYEFGVSSYVKVWEMHKDGSFHLHGLINRTISKKWLKTNARQCGIGYQVEIHAVDNAGQVAGYISKYFLKSEGQAQARKFVFPRGLRRIEVSRNWLKLPDLKADTLITWFVQTTREGQILRAGEFHNRGFEIIDNVKE